MKGGDWPSLDARNEDSVSVVLMLLNKVTGSLFGRNGNQWNTLAAKLLAPECRNSTREFCVGSKDLLSRLKPDNLWLILLSLLLVTS